jgi:hypothetical protein
MKWADKFEKKAANNWNNYNCDLERKFEKSRLHKEFLKNSAVSGEDFVITLCPQKTKNRSTTNKKRPIERKDDEKQSALKKIREDDDHSLEIDFDVSNITFTL